MAYNKKYPKIEYRTDKRYTVTVDLDKLPKVWRRFMLDHPNVYHFMNDEQKLKAVMGLFRGSNDSSRNKLFYDWRQGDMKSFTDLQESYSEVDWVCALSGRPIKSKMGEFDAKNFVHPEYWDTLNDKIDQRVVRSSILFRQKCEELLRDQQKELMTIFKRNSRSSKKS